MATTVTVTQTNTVVQPQIRYDAIYVKTLPGILKAACVLLNFIGFLCIEFSSASSGKGNFFNTIAMVGFWFSGIMLVFYMFHVVEKFFRIPWLKIEFIFCALWTFFYLIAASLVIATGWDAYVAAGFFGFLAMIAYGVDAFLKFRAVKAGEIAQGSRTVTQQHQNQHTAVGPAVITTY